MQRQGLFSCAGYSEEGYRPTCGTRLRHATFLGESETDASEVFTADPGALRTDFVPSEVCE